MNPLFKLGYWLGVVVVVSAVWNFILPDTMITELKIRFSAYVVLFFIMLYFVIKNIGLNKNNDE
jgi:hypothetical protein